MFYFHLTDEPFGHSSAGAGKQARQTLPEIVVLMFGGNDVACRRGSGPPPTNNYIATAIIETACEVIRRGVLVIVIPILPRTVTQPEITGVSPREYNIRADIINQQIERELTNTAGYNPMIETIKILNPENLRQDLVDGVHFSRTSYTRLVTAITSKVEETPNMLRELNRARRDEEEHRRNAQREEIRRREEEMRKREVERRQREDEKHRQEEENKIRQREAERRLREDAARRREEESQRLEENRRAERERK